MPSRWIGCIHRGQVGKRCSSREETHRYDPEYKSCNAGRPEYDIQSRVEFWTEPSNEKWPSSVQRVRAPSMSRGQDNL